MTVIGTREINGIECEVDAALSGNWQIKPVDDDGATWTARGSSLDAAVADARKEINKRKVKVSVPFRTLKGEHAVATGLHGGTGKVMAKVQTAWREEVQQYERHATVLRADTPDEVIEQIVSKRAEANKLGAEADKLRRQYEMRLGAELEKAIVAVTEQV